MVHNPLTLARVAWLPGSARGDRRPEAQERLLWYAEYKILDNVYQRLGPARPKIATCPLVTVSIGWPGPRRTPAQKFSPKIKFGRCLTSRLRGLCSRIPREQRYAQIKLLYGVQYRVLRGSPGVIEYARDDAG